MKLVKRLLMGAGAVALAGILVLALVPKKARAAVATLVLVSNTQANPAGTEDISKAASQIVELLCYDFTSALNQNQCGQQGPQETFSGTTAFTVPQGQNFVITSVDLTPDAGGTGVCSAILSQLIQGTTSETIAREEWFVPTSTSTEFQFAPSGIVIGSGASLFNESSSCAKMTIHGYLTAN